MKELSKVAGVVQRYLATSGRNVSYLDYSTKIQEFLSWYKGKVDWHKYQVFNGETNTMRQRKSLCMAKTVCEDLASLQLNEKVEININDEKAKKFVDTVCYENNFREEANRNMELTNALGTGAFVLSTDEDGNIKIDCINGDMVFPLTWDNGIITECAFVRIGGDDEKITYTIIQHLLEKGKYVIKVDEVDEAGHLVLPQTIACKMKEETTTKIYETGIEIPLFQIVRTPIVNNYDKTNPLGISVFANAIDTLKCIDIIYDSWYNEFELGKKRIFVKSDLKKVQVDYGEGISSQIDNNDLIFYIIDWTETDKAPIYESNMTIRASEHIESLDKQLNLLSRKVGLGDGFYSFNGSLTQTATGVISANSSMFRNLRKQELILERALVGLAKGILALAGMNYDIEITVDFDDSIIEDTEKKSQELMSEYNAGLLDMVGYWAEKKFKGNREQAKKFVAEMQATDTMKEASAMMNGGFEF